MLSTKLSGAVLTGFALLLGACREAPQPAAQAPADTAVVETEADSGHAALIAALRQPKFGDLDSMRHRRAIRVLVPMSRTYFFYDGLRERGTAAEFFREFEIFLNKRQRTERTPTAVIFLPVARDQILTELAAGRGDIAAGAITVTERRGLAVDFSRSIADSVSEIVVTGPGAPALTRIEDLSGHEVYVRASSAYAEALTALNRTLAAQGKAPIRIKPANEDLEDEDILDLVNAGVVPITIVNDYAARFWATVLDSITPRPDLAVETGRQLAYAVRKSSPLLLAQLNAFVPGHRIGTSFGNTVARRYLKDNRWVRSTDATAERRRVTATIGYFQRYARQYDLNFLLLMAQGFQESMLRQDLRSHAGAVGVMQVLPSTAEAPPISIRGVATNPDNNIRAGAKYMRWLADNFFADTAMTRFNRQVFCLAAYNAGPGRVAGLRRKARAQGLDPNVWFQNVELVAGQEIGTETTTYVRNILKYYVTYQMTVDTAGTR